MSQKMQSKNETKKACERKKQILDAALAVFLRKGFNGSTTREIASEAGVAEGTIFRYFKTKKDLLLELVAPHVIHSLADTLEAMSGESDEAVLKAVIKNRLAIFNSKKDLVQLMLTEAQFHPELKEQFVEQIIMKVAGVLEEFMQKRIDSGDFRDIDPKVTTRALVGMVGVFVIWKQFLQAGKYLDFNYESLTETIVDIFLNGVRKSTEKGE